MNQKLNLPKKLLRVEDLTFELPDDFEGDIQCALQLLVDYLKSMFGGKEINPTIGDPIPSLFEDPERRKVTMKFGIFERGEDGTYHLQ